MFDIIVAVDLKNGIGKNNSIPWKLTSELSYFAKITTSCQDITKQNAIIMGRKTYDSLPIKPLKKRLNVVISSSNHDNDDSTLWFNNFDTAYNQCLSLNTIENIFVIGGQSLYDTAINHKDLRFIYLTKIQQSFDCDTFFPQISDIIINQNKIDEIELCENNIKFNCYKLKNPFQKW